MTDASATGVSGDRGDHHLSVGRLSLVVALVSGAVLLFELCLMRLLLVAVAHHFAFLVISVVLLGYGASGTALVFARSRVMRRPGTALFGLCLSAAAAMPISWAVSQHVGVEARIVPGTAARQVAAWVLFWGMLTVPFFLGAMAAGLALMLVPRRSGAVYGANLLGSAAGAVAAPLLMLAVPPPWLPLVAAVPALAAALIVPVPARRKLVIVLTVAGVVGAWLLLDPPRVRVDPWKYRAFMQRLEDQGDVERVGVAYGPRGVIEAFSGPRLHDVPFVTGSMTPPPVSRLLSDGNAIGSVLEVADVDAAAIVDQTLLATPYEVLGRSQVGPAVLLLGETGGLHVWLAARHGARTIDVVQPDGNVIALMRGPLRARGGAVLERPEVRVHVESPRTFVRRAAGPYDLIQLCGLQSIAAGSGGAGGLAEDHLATVEGVARCLALLGDEGVVTVSRAIQTPPRDNIKLAALMVAALQRAGVTDPGAHLVVVRDYLAVCTIAKATPWSPEQLRRLRAVCRARQLTPVWFTGVQPHELNIPDELPAAPDGVGDLYHHAIRRLVSGGADELIDQWAFDVRPPTDDRPFFADFCRLGALGAMRAVYGELWLTRAEVGFLFVLTAMVLVGVIGVVAIVLPLRRVATDRRRQGAIVLYFGCLGLAYLLVEMVYLSKVTVILGHAVPATSVTIGSFLVFSGLGSLLSQKLTRRPVFGLRLVLSGVVVTTMAGLVCLQHIPAGAPAALRWVMTIAALAAPALLMGFPMPMGLTRLGSSGGAGRIAWAWGINGFASVLAPPLAIVMAMTWGYSVVAVTAILLYSAAAVVFGRLPRT